MVSCRQQPKTDARDRLLPLEMKPAYLAQYYEGGSEGGLVAEPFLAASFIVLPLVGRSTPKTNPFLPHFMAS